MMNAGVSSKQAEPARRETRRSGRRLAFLPLLIVVAGIAAYHNSFQGAFVYDDPVHIHTSERIRQFFPLSHLLAGRRPVVDFTLAVNYALGGLERWGYHALNLGVHLLAALTLYGVLRRTLLLDRIGWRDGRARWLALTVALIWVVHPLQTQSVTYIIQRGESLMGLFYLLTLYCVIRGATGRHGEWWYAGAFIACLLGQGSKAVMLTAPVTVFLYDTLFLAGSATAAWRRRWPLYVALLATFAVLVHAGVVRGVLSTAPHAGKSVGFAFKGITPPAYALTQAGVLVHYLRLALWPDSLCLDYAWPVASTAGSIVPPAIVVLSLLSVTIWALRHKRWLGFVGAWFFLILAPTSTIVPIRDPLVEHRMYLPLASVVVLLVLLVDALLNRVFARRTSLRAMAWCVRGGLVIVTVGALAYLTVRRNEVYQSGVAVWRDVTTKRPNNARGFLNYGAVLGNAGQEAMDAYRRAVELRPDYADAHYNIGMIYNARGQTDKAIESYRQAIAADPAHARAAFNLANIFADRGEHAAAIAAYKQATQADPTHFKAWTNLGLCLREQGELGEAVSSFRAAVRAAPQFIEARTHLAYVLATMGKLDEAVAEYGKALRMIDVPKHKDVVVRICCDLGRVLLRQGKLDEAIRLYHQALAILPRHAEATYGLGLALARRGDNGEAVKTLERALELAPGHAGARKALETLRRSSTTP